MNGPEHYREAERLLQVAHEAGGVIGDLMTSMSKKTSIDQTDIDAASVGAAAVTSMLASAQVHATLALTAATAYSATKDYVGDRGGDSYEWTKATAPTPKRASE